MQERGEGGFGFSISSIFSPVSRSPSMHTTRLSEKCESICTDSSFGPDVRYYELGV